MKSLLMKKKREETISMVIAIILATVGLGIYIGFVRNEGKDERGQEIIAKSSQVAFIFILIGFVFQGFFIQFTNPTVEQIQTFIYVWMALVFASNGVSILVLQRKM